MKKKLKIGIIGAGFAGLAAADSLSEKGFDVTVFEANTKPGGLAIGMKEKKWNWSLEHHYHHLFTSDYHIQDLAKKVGHEIIFVRPKTSTYYKNKIYQLDSPKNVLLFDPISLSDRIRLAANFLFLRFFPFWQILEKTTTYKFLTQSMGKNNWEVLWKPLMVKKFGKYYKEVSASWFWARIQKRSAKLGYPRGGFLALANTVVNSLKKRGVKFYFGKPVQDIHSEQYRVTLVSGNKSYTFDKVICTLPTPFFFSVASNLDPVYKEKYKGLKGLGAINLVLLLNRPYFKDGTYWLNVNDTKMKFLAVVEHTNFMDVKEYNKAHIIYIGNYLERNHRYFSLNEEQLFDEYFSDLKKINSNFDKQSILKKMVFKAPFAQPVIPVKYSKLIPPIKTPLKNVYLANIQQVYPWDRGTNYAVEIGQRVANEILKGSSWPK